jgi:hypothetical protein
MAYVTDVEVGSGKIFDLKPTAWKTAFHFWRMPQTGDNDNEARI